MRITWWRQTRRKPLERALSLPSQTQRQNFEMEPHAPFKTPVAIASIGRLIDAAIERVDRDSSTHRFNSRRYAGVLLVRC